MLLWYVRLEGERGIGKGMVVRNRGDRGWVGAGEREGHRGQVGGRGVMRQLEFFTAVSWPVAV